MSEMQRTMAPVESAERIQILDILRGFAVFGILAVNIRGFSSPYFWPGYVVAAQPWYDGVAELLVTFLAEAKFYTIFSFLFGLGFAVQLQRAEARGRDIRSFYRRRLAILFCIGLLHAVLLWTGDILRLYALLGFALLAFRKCTNRTLLIVSGGFFLLSFMIVALLEGQTGAGGIPGVEVDVVALVRAAYTSPSVLDLLIVQVFGGISVFLFLTFTQGPSVMALFLLGLVAGRLGIFARLGEHRQLASRVLVFGIPVALGANALFVFSDGPWWSALGLTIGAPTLAAVYVAGLSLVSLRTRGARILAPLANVGRMALTNYILQSVVCVVLFYGIGFGLYEKVGAAGLVGITVVIYLAQIPLSGWWLGRYRYGPLEWLWRSLTYGARQPMRLPRDRDIADASANSSARL